VEDLQRFRVVVGAVNTRVFLGRISFHARDWGIIFWLSKDLGPSFLDSLFLLPPLRVLMSFSDSERSNL